MEPPYVGCYEFMAQPRRGLWRFRLQNRAANLVQARLPQGFRVEWGRAGQKFVEQHAQAVDVTARVDVQAAHFGLLRTHVGGRADELLEGGEDGLVGQALAGGGLGDAEINDLGTSGRTGFAYSDENVRRFDVAVDDALLVRMLNGLANLDAELEPAFGGNFA